MSCQGEPIEMEDLRTAGQKDIMEALGKYLLPNIGMTRDPYPGMLSAPPDQAQLAAMDTMMGLGGRVNYNTPQMQMGPGLRVGPAAGPGVAGTHTMAGAAGPPVTTQVSTYTQGPRVVADARVRTYTGQPSVMSTKARLVPGIGPSGPTSPATSASPGLGIDVRVWASANTRVWPRSASVQAYG